MKKVYFSPVSEVATLLTGEVLKIDKGTNPASAGGVSVGGLPPHPTGTSAPARVKVF